MPPIFHDSLQSSAAWRVRIALALKGIEATVRLYEIISKEHRTPDFLRLNPQGTVPVVEIDGLRIPQSLAIIEYLEETRPTPPLLPRQSEARARVRVLSHIIAMETHAVTNMDVARDGAKGDDVNIWMARYITRGFDAVEAHLDHPDTGTFCHGDRPGMADCCLIPQARNAERAGVGLGAWPRISDIYSRALAHPGFRDTHPDHVA